MKLDMNTLQEAGAFAGPPVEKEIVWQQGDTEMKVTAYVRKLSYRSAVSDIKLFGTSGDMIAGRIAACICDEKGAPIFTVADVTGEADPARGPLNHNLTIALLNAIGEVNSLGKPTA